MSMLLMVQVMKAKVGSSTRKLVLLKLADNANDDGYCWPSYQHVADQCEISKRSAMRHINDLEKAGFLRREYRKTKDGNNRSNAYQLFSQPRKMDATGQHCTLLDDTRQNERGDNLTPGGSDTVTPGSDTESLGSDTVSPGGSDTVSPRISHSLEPVTESVKEPCREKIAERRRPDNLTRSKPEDINAETDKAFERFWQAGMRKVDKMKARKAFARKCKDLKRKPSELADDLILDVHKRIDNKVFGFDRLHPTTYLNNERWNDEVPITDPATGKIVGAVGKEEFTENEDGSYAL